MATEIKSGTPTTARKTLRLRFGFTGELGLWPVVIALGLIAIGFWLAAPVFLSVRNLSYLVLQTATLGTLTIAVVLALVIGEIDLSVGSVSGLAASVMAILMSSAGWSGPAGMLAALVTGAIIGLLQGAWIVFFRAPSFIVTLAGLLIWQGVQLALLSSQGGQLRVQDPFVIGIASNFLPKAVGWLLAAGTAIVAVSAIMIRRWLRARASLNNDPAASDAARVITIILLSLGVAWILSSYHGVPVLLVILLGLTVIFAVVAGSSVFGRHMYAVGGNSEAARRAGIKVPGLRLTIFVTVSTLAAFGGVLEASRVFSVSVNSGGNISLNAIAAAVIGGTSLFGGRGKLVGALLGALVISSVQNGLQLIDGSAAAQTIATGIILLAAVTLDVTARRRRLSVRNV